MTDQANPLQHLIDNNQFWSQALSARDPDYFPRLSRQQHPKYLWIGCSDSRVPANEVVGLMPGELFVHRNVANMVVATDMNLLSVLQYAVDVLKVEHIIVCGHYGCGGVEAALHNRSYGLIDNWLRHVQDVRNKHSRLLSECANDNHQFQRLCELNVIEQVVNVCQTTMVQTAWLREQQLMVHGWVYDVHDGLVRDLGMSIGGDGQLAGKYTQALSRLS